MIPSASLDDAKNVRSWKDLLDLFGITPILVGGVPIDILTSVDEVHEWNVTEKTITDNSFFTDMRIKKPVKISMTCVLTNDIENISPSMIGKKMLGSLVGGDRGLKSWKEKRKKLEEMAKKNSSIDLIFPNRKLKNFMITNLTFSQASALDACFFSIDMVEVFIQKIYYSLFEIPREEDVDQETQERVAKKKNAGAIRLEDSTITGSDSVPGFEENFGSSSDGLWP